MRKPNSIIVLLYIFHTIHPQKQKRSVQPFCFWGDHSNGLSNQADVELDMINAICSRYCIYHVKFTSYCELIECSRPIRFFIVSLMYNKICYHSGIKPWRVTISNLSYWQWVVIVRHNFAILCKVESFLNYACFWSKTREAQTIQALLFSFQEFHLFVHFIIQSFQLEHLKWNRTLRKNDINNAQPCKRINFTNQDSLRVLGRKIPIRPGQRTRMTTSKGSFGFLSKYCDLFLF